MITIDSGYNALMATDNDIADILESSDVDSEFIKLGKQLFHTLGGGSLENYTYNAGALIALCNEYTKDKPLVQLRINKTTRKVTFLRVNSKSLTVHSTNNTVYTQSLKIDELVALFVVGIISQEVTQLGSTVIPNMIADRVTATGDDRLVDVKHKYRLDDGYKYEVKYFILPKMMLELFNALKAIDHRLSIVTLFELLATKREIQCI